MTSPKVPGWLSHEPREGEGPCKPIIVWRGEENPTRARKDNITGRTYLERGRSVLVLTRWAGQGPRNVLIKRWDGSEVVRPFRGLRVLR